jgi:hypothetical protein
MKEEVIHLSDHLKGLTDGERTILWQAMTVDILGRALEEQTDWINVAFHKEPGWSLAGRRLASQYKNRCSNTADDPPRRALLTPIINTRGRYPPQRRAAHTLYC